MKKLMQCLLFVIAWIYPQTETQAVIVAGQSTDTPANDGGNHFQSSFPEMHEAIKGLSESQKKRLAKKSAKFEKKLDRKKITLKDYANSVFNDRYFILGGIFVLVGIGLAILGGIVNAGLLSWLGGIAAVVGIVLIIIAIIRTV